MTQLKGLHINFIGGNQENHYKSQSGLPFSVLDLNPGSLKCEMRGLARDGGS